jgi:hypothetical protein
VVVALVWEGMMMPSEVYFRIMEGSPPYIVILAVTKTISGKPRLHFIDQGEEFGGVSYEDMARAERGTLCFGVGGRCAMIVSNDN